MSKLFTTVADLRLPAGGVSAREPASAEGALNVSLSGRGSLLSRGHSDYRQSIAKNLERITKPETARTQTNGRIVPGAIGAVNIRASGALSMLLESPPTVPASQRDSTGRARQRDWHVSVTIFHKTETDVTWPAGVVWGRIGYALTGGEVSVDPATGATSTAPYVLEELIGPPPNPRPSGSADRFELVYVEASRQWIAASVVIGGAGLTEPKTPGEGDPLPDDLEDKTEEPTVDPEAPAPEDAGENGAPSPSDPDYVAPDGSDYTDPLTSELLIPTAPNVSRGTLVALSDSLLNVSENGGHEWSVMNTGLLAPIGFSVLANQPAIIAANDGLYSYDMASGALSLIPLVYEKVIDLGLVNGDFEGGMNGWETVAGDSPRAIAGEYPEQRAGSAHYLTRDWQIFTSASFTVEQTVSISPEVSAEITAGAVPTLMGWAFAQEGATATVRLLSCGASYIDGGAIYGAGLGGPGGGGYSDPVSAIAIAVDYGAPTVDIELSCVNSYDNDGVLYNASVRFSVIASGIEYTHAAFSESGVFASEVFLRDRTIQREIVLTLTSAFAGGVYTLTIPAGWRVNVDEFRTSAAGAFLSAGSISGSSDLSLLRIVGLPLGTTGDFSVSMTSSITSPNSSTVASWSASFEFVVAGETYSGAVSGSNQSFGVATIAGGTFSFETTVVMTSAGGGSMTLTVPAGWRGPDPVIAPETDIYAFGSIGDAAPVSWKIHGADASWIGAGELSLSYSRSGNSIVNNPRHILSVSFLSRTGGFDAVYSRDRLLTSSGAGTDADVFVEMGLTAPRYISFQGGAFLEFDNLINTQKFWRAPFPTTSTRDNLDMLSAFSYSGNGQVFVQPVNYHGSGTLTATVTAGEGQTGEGAGQVSAIIVRTQVELGSAVIVGGDEWTQIIISAAAGAALGDTLTVSLDGAGSPANVAFDEFFLSIRRITEGLPTAIGRDVARGRTLVASEAGVFSIKNGAITRLAESPATNITAIASNSAARIFVTDGSGLFELVGDEWSQFDSLSNGELYSGPTVAQRSGGFLSSVGNPTDIILADFARYDRLRSMFLATRDGGAVSSASISSDGLLTPGPDIPDMPVTSSVSVAARGILSTDAGRIVGWARGMRDIYYLDASNFIVGMPLKYSIIDIQEVK